MKTDRILQTFYQRLFETCQTFDTIPKKEETLNVKDTKYTQAFEKLKSILTSDQILSYPNFNLPFILTTDASNYALGAVLSQVQDKIERPIALANRSLNKTENIYSTTEKEALVII